MESRGTIVPWRLNTAQPAIRGLLFRKYEKSPIHYSSLFNFDEQTRITYCCNAFKAA
jgi:hypothetical protein